MEERPCHPAAGSTAGPSGDIFMGVGLGQALRQNGQSAVQPRAGKTGHRGCVRRGQREAASGGSATRPLPPVHSTTWISEGPTPRGGDPPHTWGHTQQGLCSLLVKPLACYPSEPVRGQASWPKGHSPPVVCPISAWVTHRLRKTERGTPAGPRGHCLGGLTEETSISEPPHPSSHHQEGGQRRENLSSGLAPSIQSLGSEFQQKIEAPFDYKELTP